MTQQAKQDVDFVERLLARWGARAVALEPLRSRITAVRQRLAEPRLHLALVGEFSSGKSSVVNGLLRQRILSTSAVPTTAVPTRISHGTRVELTVRLTGFAGVLTCVADDGPVTDSALIRQLLAIVPGLDTPERFDDVVRLVTCDPRITSSVTSVELRHPAPLLGSGLVLLDLPGLNGGADAEHIRAAVSDQADIAVVVLSATVGVTRSLVEFLTSTLDRVMLDRCVFLLTKITLVDAGERAALIDDVRARLVDKLGVTSPEVVPVSVTSVLPKQGRHPVGEDRYWAARFRSMEALLVEQARRSHDTAADGVLRSLNQLLGDVGAQLRRQDDELSARAAALAERSLADVGAFADAQHRRVARDLDVAVSAARKVASAIVAQREAQLRATARAALTAASSRAALDRAVSVTLPAAVADEIQQLEQLLRKDIFDARLVPAAKRAAKKVDTTFAAEHRTLKSLTGSRPDAGLSWASDGRTVAEGPASGWASSEVTRRLDLVTAKASMGGAAGGALLGTAVIPIPVVGTLVGLVVGAGVGALFGPGIATSRNHYAESVDRSIDGLIVDVRQRLERNLIDFRAAANGRANQQIDAYAKRYRRIVDDANERTAAERRRVAAHRAELVGLKRDVERRMQVIARERTAMTGQRRTP